jgi:hypothetical protein
MGDNINDILSSIISHKHNPESGEWETKWDAQSLQRLINDVMAMTAKPVLKYKKEARGTGIRIVYYLDHGVDTLDGAPPEDVMNEIQEWCTKSDCGKRLSFDTFYFKNEEAYLMFSLRWQ